MGHPTPRPFLFGTNLKMHQTPVESANFYRELAAAGPVPERCQRFVIPPFTSLPAVTELARQERAGIWVGAQNMHWATEGAYTGEISAPMLVALGVDLVLLGHAERRDLFHETDSDVNKKVLAALEHGLRVLLCVGETADERSRGTGTEIVARQLRVALEGTDAAAIPLLQIAYEPVWSIGEGGVPAQPADVAPIVGVIRTTLYDRLGRGSQAVPVLYGGSVNPDNAAAFAAVEGIDGLFVGRAAWTASGFRATLVEGLKSCIGEA